MDTIKKLQSIFKDKFQLEIIESYYSEDISIGFAGIGLNALDMYYLIHFIETEFQIKFTPEQIKSGKIRTLKGLFETVEHLRNTEVGKNSPGASIIEKICN